MISPVLLGAAGGGGSSIGGARAILQRFRSVRDFIRLARAFRSLGNNKNIFSHIDDLYSIRYFNRAPVGGLATLGEKSFEAGQFIYGSQRSLFFGRQFSGLSFQQPFAFNSIRPYPVFYPQLSSATRRIIEIGGPALILNRSYQIHRKKLTK